MFTLSLTDVLVCVLVAAGVLAVLAGSRLDRGWILGRRD